MIRVSFDITKPGWQSFGRILFVASEAEAEPAARAAALADGSELCYMETREARPGEYERWAGRMDRIRRWKENLAAGITNPRGLL